MKKSITLLAASIVCMLAVTATHAQSAETPLQFERGFPTAESVKQSYDASDLNRAIEAYKFFYPTMGTEAVFQQLLTNGAEFNKIGHVMATSPKQQFGGANADTPYALVPVDLELSGPMVVEIPAGPFIGFVDDHNMRWVQDMGMIGPNKGKGGKHLILPPNYKGKVPSGYSVGESKTNKVVVFVRMVPQNGDVDAAVLAAHGIKVYPLSKPGQKSEFKFLDMSSKTLTLPILSWEKNLEYWRQLHAVVQTETAVTEYRPFLGMLAQLGIQKGKPFNPDARMKKILTKAARTAVSQMRINSYAKRNPEYIAWEGRNWEWLLVKTISDESGDFGYTDYLNLEANDEYFFLGYGTSAAIGKRAVGAGAIYFVEYRDTNDQYLDGSKHYTLTVPASVPASLFWSNTVYDADTRVLIATDQNKAALRSHIDNLEQNADGTYTFYYGPTAPKGKENMWIKTIPGKGWWSVFRIYGPKAPSFDGSWKLDDYVEIQ